MKYSTILWYEYEHNILYKTKLVCNFLASPISILSIYKQINWLANPRFCSKLFLFHQTSFSLHITSNLFCADVCQTTSCCIWMMGLFKRCSVDIQAEWRLNVMNYTGRLVDVIQISILSTYSSFAWHTVYILLLFLWGFIFILTSNGFLL